MSAPAGPRSDHEELLELALGEVRVGIPTDRVVEVTGRVLLTRLPVTIPHVLGVFGYRGRVAVAVDGRARLGQPPKRPAIDDHFVILSSRRRQVALVVDRVLGVRTLPRGNVKPGPVTAPNVRGIVVLEDGLMLVDDLEAVLSLDDEHEVDEAVTGLPAP